MIRRRHGLAASLGIMCCAFMFVNCRHGGNTEPAIGREGNISRIVFPESAGEIVSLAAAELQKYFQKITGKELAIEKEAAGKYPEESIRLRLVKDPGIKWDGYKIDVYTDSIVLTANVPRGLLYAAYSLLEGSGCAFVYPGEEEEAIPKLALIKFTPGNEVFTPTLEHRGLAPYGLDSSSIDLGRSFIDWMAKNKFNYILVSEERPSDSGGPAHGSMWKDVTAELLPELTKRGFIIEMSEHCTPVFFPRSLFNNHPDWFALNDGVRKLGEPPYSGQICYSNKDAIEYYGDAIAAYAVKHPEFHVIGTWPLDGGEYCECINCKDPETYFKASMRVAEKVRAVRPDMVVEYLAYQGQYRAPKTNRVPSNMSVLWCPDPGQQTADLKQWIEKTQGAGGVEEFEYLLGDNYRARANVWLRPHFAASIPEQARNSGFRGTISLFLPMQNWWRSAFNNWFYARACWTPELNVDSAIKSYCLSYYPGYGEQVNEIFQDILYKFQKEPYVIPDPARPEPVDTLKAVAAKILEKLDMGINQNQSAIVRERLTRLKSFVEFSLLHRLAFSSGRKSDLQKVVDYSVQHPEQHMVIMYPDYVKWRDEEYFQ